MSFFFKDTKRDTRYPFFFCNSLLRIPSFITKKTSKERQKKEQDRV